MRAPEAAVDTIRRESEEGYRRLEAFAPADPALYRRLADQIVIVTDELRRRVGEVFTLAELAEAYGNADRWSREALEERVGSSAHPLSRRSSADQRPSTSTRAGASDYRP